MADEVVGLSGGLYAAASVTNAIGNIIAEFRAGWTLSLEETFAEWYGQRTTRKAAQLTQLDIQLSIAEVAFKPGTYSKLWSITPGAIATKEAAPAAATSYSFDSTIVPRELEYLVECQYDAKTFQAFAQSAMIMGSVFNFTNQDMIVHNIDLILYAASGSLVDLILET